MDSGLSWETPAAKVFGFSPVGQRTISSGEGGVQLLLTVSGSVAERIVVFRLVPCSMGRTKRCKVACVGL